MSAPSSTRPWTDTPGLRILGSGLRVETRGPDAAAQVRSLWSRCLDPGAHGRCWIAADSDQALTRQQLLRLTFELNEHAIHELAGRAVMLHAGAVSDAAGRTLGLVAASGTGKTTAVVHLARQGLGYVTDETLAITRAGAVVPFPKPLSFVDDLVNPDLKRLVSPDELGLATAGDHLTLGPVVLLSRHDSRTHDVRLEQVPRLHGLRELIPHSSALRAFPRPLKALASALSGTGIYRIHYTEITDADDLLSDLLSSPTPPVEDLTDALHASIGPNVLDAVGLGEETLILHEGGQVHLGALASLVWNSVDEVSPTDIVDLARKEFGDHDEAEQIVNGLIARWREEGLLSVGGAARR